MEFLSYVIEGALAHKDSLGAGSVIRPGDVQVMTAATGIRRSEFNASKVDPVHFLQIWLLPERQGLRPRYDQMTFPESETRGRTRLVASHDRRDESVLIHQDADVFATLPNKGESVGHEVNVGRRAWVQIVHGSADIDSVSVHTGEGAAIEGAAALSITSRERDSEILVFDLP